MPKQPKEMTLCIYCIEKKKPSKEHVIPRGLGGNLTIPDVCEECNGVLSDLDASLCDASLLTLPRIAKQPGAVLGSSSGASVRFRPEHDFDLGSLEIRLETKYTPEIMAQIFFVRQSDVSYALHGYAGRQELYKDLFRTLRKLQEKNRFRTIPILAPFDEPGAHRTPRLVLNRSNQIVFRPSYSEFAIEEHEQIVGLLEKRFDDIEKSILSAAEMTQDTNIDQPSIEVRLGPDFGRNLRGVAKIALNFIAYAFGPEKARDMQLNGLREYVRTGKGADSPGSIWDIGAGEERSVSGTRYAVWIKDYCQQPFSMSRSDTHVISIIKQNGRHIMMIEFYGVYAYAVDLGNVDFSGPFPLVHEFDFVNRTNHATDFLTVAKRIEVRFLQIGRTFEI